jgi:hypothetical protein
MTNLLHKKRLSSGQTQQQVPPLRYAPVDDNSVRCREVCTSESLLGVGDLYLQQLLEIGGLYLREFVGGRRFVPATAVGGWRFIPPTELSSRPERSAVEGPAVAFALKV